MSSTYSAKRINLNWSDRLERAQRLIDGLPDKDPTGEHSSETSQPEGKSSCDTSGTRGFCFALLSAESHLSGCDKSVVAQTVPRFNCVPNHPRCLMLVSARQITLIWHPAQPLGLCSEPCSHTVPRKGCRQMFSVMKQFHLLTQANCEYKPIQTNGIQTNLHQQLSHIWEVFT